MLLKKYNIPEIKPLVFMLGVLSLLLCSSPEQSSNSFLFCLKSDYDPIVINFENNRLNTDLKEINNFIHSNGIESIERWLPYATDNDKDGDIYLNRIYRVYVSEERQYDIPQIIRDLELLSPVKYAEPEYIRKPLYTPNDPLIGVQCSLGSVKAYDAFNFWNIPAGVIPEGREVLLASVDTGVDYTHPDLQNNSWINQGEIPVWMFEAGLDENSDGFIDASEVVAFLSSEGMDVNADGNIDLRDAVSDGSPFSDGSDDDGNGYTDDLLGWDCSGWYGPDDNDPYPKEDVSPNGTWAHGTHVAGIMAATTDNELGIASTSYNAKYISVKVSRDNQTGEPGINDGYAGILYAAKAGYYAGSFSIINNSWGGGGFSASENSTINTAQNTYGAIVLGAAGNDNEYEEHYPSSYENCISVCAIGCSYAWGGWATYHPTVDLAAPGESVYSAIIGSGYEAWDGSSMACPNAASAIGLLSSYYPEWNNIMLRERIEDSADRRIYEVNPEYQTCNGYGGEDCLGKGMVDVYKAIGMDFSPNLSIEGLQILSIGDDDSSTLIDDDNVLNPGEDAVLSIVLENEIGWSDAGAVIATLSTENEYITITEETSVYGSIGDGSNVERDFTILVSPSISLGTVEFVLNVVASGDGGYEYSTDLDLEIDVTLYQEGFPFGTSSEIKSSPIVADLDNDGDKEIVFADYFGIIRVINDGEELNNDVFPFETGDQIWGSVSGADLDLDGLFDFVVSSKNGHIYIFDINGLKVDYNADRWLIATPVIGNIDQDPELEIVVGGYQSPTSTCPIIGINHDGSDVDGFPYIIGEKMKAGVALADMNNNGIDDIIFGTDTDNLYVLLDDLSVATGFPLDLGSNLRSEPAVLEDGDDKIILIGCDDDNFYAFNYDASLRFIVPTGANVSTSPAFKDTGSGVEIYFGSDDGNVYGVDKNGDSLPGFPQYVGGDLEAGVVGSVVFSDIDNDNSLDLVAVNNKGEIYAFDESQNLLEYFPIYYQDAFSSAPMIEDYDLDGDLEIISGTTGSLVVLDYKYSIDEVNESWSMFKGNTRRSGYYITSDDNPWDCPVANIGDLNCDTIINILDIVMVVNIVVGGEDGFDDYELWAADINSDNIINVLDIVLLVNIVVSG